MLHELLLIMMYVISAAFGWVLVPAIDQARKLIWHIYIPMNQVDTSYIHLDVDGKGVYAGIAGHIWGVEWK
jgi:hypothetical protein